MFKGIHNINLDAKGRLAIPVKYREFIAQHCSGEMVVTIENNGGRCLLIYPKPEWEDVERQLRALSSQVPASRRLQRLYIGHAMDVELDGSGRILVPPPLREYAELDKKTVLVGQSNKFELWDEELWKQWREMSLDEGTEWERTPEIEQLSL